MRDWGLGWRGPGQRYLNRMFGPEANHTAVLGFKPLVDVKKMKNSLELEPFRSIRSPPLPRGYPCRGLSANAGASAGGPRWCLRHTQSYAWE